MKFILWLFDDMLQISELKTDQSIQSEQYHLMLETGQEIAKGLDIYLKLLKHLSYLVRIATGKLLFYWFRFPKHNEHKIKTYFREFKACETHPLVKQNIDNWFEPWSVAIEGQEFPESD